MAKRIPKIRSAPSTSTNIPIYSLSGGVTTQAQSKRLPNEATELKNCIVSLERSVEKRGGFQLLLPDNYNTNIKSSATSQKFNSTGTWSISSGSSTITITRTDANQRLPSVGDKVYFYKHIYSTGGTTQATVANDIFGYNLSATSSSLSTVYYTVLTANSSTNTFTVTGKPTNITATGSVTYYVLKQSERLDLENLEHHYVKEFSSYSLSKTNGVDYFFYWFNINEANRFLVAINYKAVSNNQPILFIYRITTSGSFIDETPFSDANKTQQNASIIAQETREYITYGCDNNYARNVLKATAVGNSLVILNTLVKAGFTSGEIGWNGSTTGGKRFHLDGTETYLLLSGTISNATGPSGSVYTATVTTSRPLGNPHLKVGDRIVSFIAVTGSLGNGTVTISNPWLTDDKTTFQVTSTAAFTNGTVTNIKIENTDTEGNFVQYYSTARYIKSTTGKWHIIGTDTNDEQGSTTTNLKAKKTIWLNTSNSNWDVGSWFQCYTASIAGSITSPPLPNVNTINQWKETLSWTGASTTTIVGMPTNYTKVNPSTQTKVYFISTSHTTINPKYIIASSWTNDSNVPGGGAINPAGTEGSIWFVEQKVGTWSISARENVYCFIGYYPEVDDFVWHDTSNAYLGQSLPDFSYIKFPPEYAGEVLGNNGVVFTDSASPANSYTIDVSAQSMLSTTTGLNNGNGKIYYCQAPYLNFTSGYYRIIASNTKPYTKKIRTPDCYSVIDKRRMPQKITFNATATYKFIGKPIDWLPRTSGDRFSNPGPSVFLTVDKKPKQVEINALSVFRDRLYFAAEDVVFSSQLGTYEDLFLADPSNIVATDPIDIRASNNSYAEITSLTPFSSYLFINTSGNVQYELKGSQNQITPLTAEISPTSFYSTAKFLEPKLLGSLIYFFDKQRLYLYLGSENSDLATAQELTVTSYGYLPTYVQDICIAPSQNNIILLGNALDTTETVQGSSEIYFHASRFSGDKNLQNAFWKWEIASSISGAKIVSIQSFDDYVYSVIKIPTSWYVSYIDPLTNNLTTNVSSQSHYFYKYFIVRSTLKPDSFKLLNDTVISNNFEILPRLDSLLYTHLTDNNSDYDFNTNTTTLRFPISFFGWGQYNLSSYSGLKLPINVITTSTPTVGSWYSDLTGATSTSTSDRSGEIAIPTSFEIYDCFSELKFSGRYVPTTYNSSTKSLQVNYGSTRSLWFGCPFDMTIELSEQFVRDQNNSIIDGSLNLKTMSIRHKFTGEYNVIVKNLMNSESRTYTFTPQSLNTTDVLSLEFYETEGSFNCPILGFSNQTNIKLQSKNPYPLNISYIEFGGKFIRKKSITDLY